MKNCFMARYTNRFELVYMANGVARNICIKQNPYENDYTSIIEDEIEYFNNRKESLRCGEKISLPTSTSLEYPLHDERILISWEDELGNKLSEEIKIDY